jgi:hypothetical protein
MVGALCGEPRSQREERCPLLLVAAGLLMGQQGEKARPRVPLYAKQGPWKVHGFSALRDVADCCCNINYVFDGARARPYLGAGFPHLSRFPVRRTPMLAKRRE